MGAGSRQQQQALPALASPIQTGVSATNFSGNGLNVSDTPKPIPFLASSSSTLQGCWVRVEIDSRLPHLRLGPTSDATCRTKILKRGFRMPVQRGMMGAVCLGVAMVRERSGSLDACAFLGA